MVEVQAPEAGQPGLVRKQTAALVREVPQPERLDGGLPEQRLPLEGERLPLAADLPDEAAAEEGPLPRPRGDILQQPRDACLHLAEGPVQPRRLCLLFFQARQAALQAD